MREFLALLLTAATLLVLPSLACAQEAGDEWTEPITGMEFVWVPGGCYEMGCGEWAGDCESSELPVHEVCVDGFWMGKYEVTKLQWYSIMKSPEFASDLLDGNENLPMDSVSWYDVQRYITRISAIYLFRYQFRLPTEAEWEYACRSCGLTEVYSGSNDINDIAWHRDNSDNHAHFVGTKLPNSLGIYDMNGNVWEWVEDVYNKNSYSIHPVDNPLIRYIGFNHVLRGGSWGFYSSRLGCNVRLWGSYGDYDIGFRLSRAD